jgi:hypothetical protein
MVGVVLVTVVLVTVAGLEGGRCTAGALMRSE